MPNSRRRRRRRSTSLSAGAPPPEVAAASRSGPRPEGAAPSTQTGPQTGPQPDTGEQVWERTHLEQMMFALARDHADAAARCARATPPDRAGEQTHSLISILMSFLALEAFINMAGGDRLGTRYRHYDRMSLEGKWLEVTRLATKQRKTFDEEGRELRGLSTLRNWRNMLTHYKGEYEEVQPGSRGGETKVEALLSGEHAARALETARGLYRAFYEWDRRSPPRQFIWLDDRPHGPQAAAGSPQPGPTPAVASGAAQAGRAAPRAVRPAGGVVAAAHTARPAAPGGPPGSAPAAGSGAPRRRRRRR